MSFQKSFSFFILFAAIIAVFLGTEQVQAFTLSATSVTIPQNQNTYVSISASSGVSVSNSNSLVTSVSLSGSQLTMSGLSVGSSVITVCVTSDGCQSISVSVTTSNTTSTTTSTPPTFSTGNSITILGGQSQSITMSGNGGYTVTSNSNPSVAGASIGGTTLYVMGNGQGGDNITVCDGNNQCSSLYVSVSGISVASTIPPNLISFTVGSTNHNNSFLGAGSSLTIDFTTNQPMTTVSVDVNGQSYIPTGSGTGPFMVNYQMQGTEPTPLPILINYAEADGTRGTFAFDLGNPSSVPSVPPVTSGTGDTGCVAGNTYSTTTGAPCPLARTTVASSSPSSSIMSYIFNDPLYAGMTSTEVLALQERLTAEGVYSGPHTGFYGPLTVTAVKAYQAKVGLAQLGNVGPGTRAALNSGK